VVYTCQMMRGAMRLVEVAASCTRPNAWQGCHAV